MDIDEELEIRIKERRSKGVRITGKTSIKKRVTIHSRHLRVGSQVSKRDIISLSVGSTHVSQKPVEIVNDKVDKFLNCHLHAKDS